MLPITKKPNGILLHLYVQPKSAKNAIAGLYNDALKIRITAPPTDNKANQMCLKFLAKELSLPKSSLEIVSGQTSRSKQVFIPYTSETSKNKQEKQLIEKITRLIK
ncbi:MAG: DUF167 domain-containing protein [Desulfobacterales bacterium]|nr:DUF167 domain-containing protein [Desulfobacterales bacterium]